MFTKLILVLFSAFVIAGCGSEEMTAPLTGDSSDRMSDSELAMEPEEVVPGDEISGEILASIALADGSELTFRRQDGVIVAAAMSASEDDAAALQHLGSDLTPVELYRECSGKAEIPHSLQRAWDEVSAAIASGFVIDDAPQQDLASEEAASPDQDVIPFEKAMSGSTFSSYYCGGSGYDWSWCYTNRTGNMSIQKSGAGYSNEHVHSVYGHIRIRQSFWKLTSWKTAGTCWIYGGETCYGYLQTWPRTTPPAQDRLREWQHLAL